MGLKVESSGWSSGFGNSDGGDAVTGYGDTAGNSSRGNSDGSAGHGNSGPEQFSTEEEKQLIALKIGLTAKIIDLAKALIVADAPFISAAIGRLEVVPSILTCPFATDARYLYVDIDKLLDQYLETRVPPKEDLLHVLLHCIFVHPFASETVHKTMWNLACDIVAERAVLEICGAREGTRGSEILNAVQLVNQRVEAPVTAEKVYRALKSGIFNGYIGKWQKIFPVDDHQKWYVEGNLEDIGMMGQDGEGDDDDEGSEGPEIPGDSDASSGDRETSEEDESSSGSGDEESQEGDDENSGGSDDSEDDRSEDDGKGQGGNGDEQESQSGDSNSFMDARSEWEEVSRKIGMEIQMSQGIMANRVAELGDELGQKDASKVDYREFLRQFAIPGEVMRLSDEEFDTTFYTYGLSLYGNLPLIEPLEYREEKRIREFVVVIDTSGSVYGDIVRKFVETTYDVLSSSENFFGKVNLRIIQCDEKVQRDDKIEDLRELNKWVENMHLKGFGGTDFRPAFEYVDKLVEEGQFENLGGLIYFTDGWGIYPEWTPKYKVAFVFYDENHDPQGVPPWALEAVITDDMGDKDERR